MKKKQIAASLLALTVACSMTACSGKPEEAADTTAAAAEQGEIAGDTNNDGQIDMGVDENVEVKQENASEHMDSFEASTSGKWEAMFTPVDMEGRAIDMADFDLTPTEEELEAMKKEPAYGQKVTEGALLHGGRMYGRPDGGSPPWILRGGWT